MNIFNKVTWGSLKKNRTRTVVTIIGVVLSVAMIAAVTTFIASFQTYLINNEIAENGNWQVKFTNVDSVFAQKVAEDSDVKTSAVLQNIGYSKLEGSRNPDKPYLFVVGMDNTALDTMPVHITKGRLPQNGSEIVISEHTDTNGGVGFNVGDSLMLELGLRTIMGEKVGQERSYQNGETRENGEGGDVFTPESTKTYTIVGICKRPGFEGYSAPGYTAITKAESAQASLDVLVTMKSPGKVYDFAERMSGSTGYEFNRGLLRYYGVSTNDNFNAVLYGLAAILIAIIMIGGILLIYNAFAISVSERSRQFGVLSSVGATGAQLRKSVLFEGVCIGAIGIPIGILSGVGGIGITLHFIGNLFGSLSGSTINTMKLSMVVSVPALVIAAVMGALTILISAYIPAHRAMRKSAIEIIRQTDDVKIKAKEVKTSKLVSALFGLEGTLAMKNFKRNKKRYRSTVISLFVSVVLFIAASAFGTYLQQGTGMTIPDYGYDISLSASQGTWHYPDEQLLSLYDRMKTVDGVYDSAYQNRTSCLTTIASSTLTDRFLQYFSETGASPGESIEYGFSVIFMNDEAYQGYLNKLGLAPSEYSLAQGREALTISLFIQCTSHFPRILKRVIYYDFFIL
ncbi:hypothetical protein AGMMS50284_4920 [Clostridia bacterium]|nr:hypothetical protein AGMMS50284_4920 [Clostridia bacterium]